MVGTARSSPRHRAAVLVACFAVALAFLVVAPMAALAAPTGAAPASIGQSPVNVGLTASVLWNGVNILTAQNASAAFHMSFNGAVNLLYTWSQGLLSAGGWSINDARLQIFYFGFALGTRDITETVGQTSGSVVMGNWSTGPLQYITEGTYRLTASLIATNGTTAWSQSFWVDVAAAYYILALLPIVLVLLAIYEAYALCCSGAHYSRTKPVKGGSPPTATEATSSPPTTAVEEPPDPALDATPPPGGVS